MGPVMLLNPRCAQELSIGQFLDVLGDMQLPELPSPAAIFTSLLVLLNLCVQFGVFGYLIPFIRTVRLGASKIHKTILDSGATHTVADSPRPGDNKSIKTPVNLANGQKDDDGMIPDINTCLENGSGVTKRRDMFTELAHGKDPKSTPI